MTNKILKHAIHITLACVAIGGMPASAQTTAEPTLDTVVVTGSRIARDADFESPIPMVTVSSDTINDNGFNVLGDVLVNLPQALVDSSLQAGGTLFNAGQSRVNMRGLGSNRTLVLLNGRRFITGDFRAPSVDLNMIPSMMIERVEVISGGASAIYGSEAIAGVVNVITRQRNGLRADVSGGISSEGDGEELNISLDYGSTFADGRGSYTFGAEFTEVEPIYQIDREWAYPGIRRNLSVTPQPVVPASRSNLMPTATFQLVSGSGAAARSVSIAQDRSTLHVNSPLCRTNTVNSLCQDPWLFYAANYNLLQGSMQRRIAHGFVDFDIADNVNVFAELTYGAVESLGVSAPAFSNPSGTGTMPIVIRGDNAYLNGGSPLAAQLTTQWLNAGRTLVRATTVNVGKYWEEFGMRNADIRRENLRVLLGSQGGFSLFGADYNWDVYLQRGELNGRVIAENMPNRARLQQAVDATLQGGVIQCNDAAARAAGCVPWDLINGPSRAAVDWANGYARFDGLATQNIAAANISGALFDLPGGQLGIAGGVEYRREASDYIQDDLSASGALFYNAIGRTAGDYNVREGYVEVVAPLLSDVPGAHQLSFEAAARVADYSTAGSVDQWRLQSTWAPVQDLSFRVSLATAVRAPNITEAFGPRSRNFTSTALDPCDSAQISGMANAQTRATRIANCASVIPGYDPNTFISNIGPGRSSLPTLSGSNDTLWEETAETLTVGMVLMPGEQDRVRLSLDFWRIHIDDAISTVPVNTLLATLCYDDEQPVSGNRFCQLISRDGVGNVTEVVLTNQNVQSIKTAGLDIGFRYDQPLGVLGEAQLQLDATRVTRWDLAGFPGAQSTKLAGVLTRGIPDFKAQGTLSWRRDRVQAQWQTRFIDSYAVSEVDSPSSREPFYTGSYIEHDLRGSFYFTDELAVRAGIVNVTDEHPPLVPEVGNATDGDSSATYDNRGRWFYLGFKYAFGN